VRGDSQGSLPLLDAVLFLAVISVVAALILAQTPPARRDSMEEVNRYARSVLDAFLETTWEPVVLPGDPNETELDAGPAYAVLAEALQVGLRGFTDYAPLEARIGAHLGNLVRADWAWRFEGRAQTGGASSGFVAEGGHGGVDWSAKDYGTAVTVLDLGDVAATRVSFSLDLVPTP